MFTRIYEKQTKDLLLAEHVSKASEGVNMGAGDRKNITQADGKPLDRMWGRRCAPTESAKALPKQNQGSPSSSSNVVRIEQEEQEHQGMT